jgi:hypothetical protein
VLPIILVPQLLASLSQLVSSLVLQVELVFIEGQAFLFPFTFRVVAELEVFALLAFLSLLLMEVSQFSFFRV